MKRWYWLTIMSLGLLFGSVIGMGLYTFWYAEGAAYLTNNPKACANCHVMNEQYAGWTKSPHHQVATCNDCHTPPGFFPKYFTKASNGFWHSYAFTTGDFHEPIQIGPRNREVTEKACRKCHSETVGAIDAHRKNGENLNCLHCHRSVGHLH